ncbi:MAG: calcium/sodium antiporter [Pseudomonadota bacterium]
MLTDFISLLGGMMLLVLAGDVMVRGAVGVAEAIGVPAIVIGLTIVAFGTSAPELFISLRAVLGDASGIAIGNVVGSNVANVLLIMGIPSIIAATSCDEPGALRSAFFMMGVTVIFAILCTTGELDLIASGILLALLAFFIADTARTVLTARRAREREAGPSEMGAAGVRSERDIDDDDDPAMALMEDVDGVPSSVLVAVLFLAGGMIGLPAGAHFTIEGAVSLARQWGVSEAAIGLTIIALGTSLPELTTTVMAAIRGQGAVAIGNVIGSNIFNLLAIMGITAAIVPVAVPAEILIFDIWAMVLSSGLLLIFTMLKLEITRTLGVIFVIFYLSYIYLVFQTGMA